ncbi:MAG: Zn-dependent rane-bound protease, family protein [Candidatus Saccharibacteria bacterium]|nr:Zn-dependent rane-bound protease, family protein [Candidatus Saccharibacteria bacterium]
MNGNFSSINILVFIVALLFSVGFHEAMHAFTAHWLGDTTAADQGRLTLNPLKHLDLYTSIILPIILILSHLPPFFAAKPVPFNPARVKYDEFGAALIGVAGPLTNFALAVLGALFLRGIGGQLSVGITDAVQTFVLINVALFVFNMIPFPPLDGSRLLYALAPEPVQDIMFRIESAGFMAIIVFILIFMTTGLGTAIVNVDNAIFRFLVGR